VTVTLTSSVPNVVVSPASVVVPAGQRFGSFTVTTGAYTGPVKLSATPSSYEGTSMTIYAAPPGATPKLDVAIDAEGSSVTFGETATITAKVAARRHDGTKPTGLVSLLDQNRTLLAQQQLDGDATTVFTRANLQPGNATYYLRYHGDANFNAMQDAQANVHVSGWKTDVFMDVPPLICASTPQNIYLTVRTTESTAAPTGSLSVTVGSTVVATLPLAPTGVPGESQAVLQRSFVAGDFYITAKYVPTGTFSESWAGRHFQTVGCIPLNVQAAATSASTIAVVWSPIAGADHYDVIRSVNRDNWLSIATTPALGFVDQRGDDWTRAFLYTVRAFDAAGNLIGWGAPDLAINMTFDDDPLVVRQTRVRAAHVQQLRIGANALRWFGVNVDVSAVTPVPVGSVIRASHITELRSEIATLRRGLGLPPIAFTHPTLAPGVPIRAIDIQELRNALK
jgi:hypothetical protein